MSTNSNKSKNTFITISSDEPTIKWADLDERDDLISITSEEDTATVYDGEERARTKNVQEIWNATEIWSQMQVKCEKRMYNQNNFHTHTHS